MHPRSTPDPIDTDADAVFARVMAEQPEPAAVPSTPSPNAVLAKAPDVAGPRVPDPAGGPQGHGGPDGKDIENGVAGYLDYLSNLAEQLGVPDPVEEYFAPVVGRWSELHNEAERWRAAAKTADEATTSLTKPLGSLDSAWRGKDADAFVQYMSTMGLAGNDLSDAMGGMAKALDKTANSVREIVQQLAGMLSDTAETTSQAMTMPAKGDHRVRMHLEEARRPTKDLFDLVRQVLEAFVKLCEGVEGGKSFDKIEMKHTFPEQNFQFPDQRVESPKLKNTDTGTHASGTDDDAQDKQSSGTASGGGSGSGGGAHAVGGGGGGGGGGGSAGSSGGARAGGSAAAEKPQPGGYVAADEHVSNGGQQAAAAASAGTGGAQGGQGGQRGGGGFGGMPLMGGMGGGGQGGDQEHKRSARVVGDPADIFGRPTKTSPSVIGDEE
ncbi:WXG100 family type VII secretion target [Labedaea rhizosphaerae]|uniref:Type VII secretion system (Wss) protein ESAT-6 n=1 Tax=Labedaea rhizosphaerae TaxID=598644 RepID=A0A4R6SQ86_LABRH|nr:WXG100 family type VII secretion target [Labedaea rhizosphaerae]TDQ05770.1 type VII secretion system (Wss) protein ESAT-6 [Labedaea rhizosphaerae]